MKKAIIKLIWVGFLMLMPAFMLYSQTAVSQKSSYLVDTNDVKSINGIITAVYDVISGPAGQRNWARLKYLCLPNVSFISIKRDAQGNETYFNGSIDEYIATIDPLLGARAYYEVEIGRTIHQSDNIAQVFSTFNSTLFESVPLNKRGVNCFNLIYYKNRWWIVNVLWNSEPAEEIIEEDGISPGQF